jgi:hypothetical protein
VTASQQGPAGPPTAPAGGNTDDLLVKSSSTNYDTRWTPYLNSVTIGANAATTGAVRLPNNTQINARHWSGGYDFGVIGTNGQSQIVVGSANGQAIMLGVDAGAQLGIGGVNPVALSTGWFTSTGYTGLKSCDPNVATLAQLARHVATLVDTLKAHGILRS